MMPSAPPAQVGSWMGRGQSCWRWAGVLGLRRLTLPLSACMRRLREQRLQAQRHGGRALWPRSWWWRSWRKCTCGCACVDAWYGSAW